ncbi:MAG: serine hydrolase domain-containing protein, partial [Gammaproteobacteria bacterium]
MNRSLNCIVIALLCCLPNVAYGLPVIDKPFTPQRDASEIADELSQFIPPAMQQEKVPGLSIAIIRDGEVIYKQAFGLDNYWAEHSMTTDKIFEVASLSKPVTAYGVLQLVDKGLIDLDEPVTRYLPSAPADVTLRQTLVHTSALLHVGTDGYARGGAPGDSFSYSPAGYLLSGDIIEQITQQSLAD